MGLFRRCAIFLGFPILGMKRPVAGTKRRKFGAFSGIWGLENTDSGEGKKTCEDVWGIFCIAFEEKAAYGGRSATHNTGKLTST